MSWYVEAHRRHWFKESPRLGRILCSGVSGHGSPSHPSNHSDESLRTHPSFWFGSSVIGYHISSSETMNCLPGDPLVVHYPVEQLTPRLTAVSDWALAGDVRQTLCINRSALRRPNIRMMWLKIEEATVYAACLAMDTWNSANMRPSCPRDSLIVSTPPLLS